MSLDDFITDDGEDIGPTVLDKEPPGDYNKWSEAEPGAPDWWDLIESKELKDDGEKSVVIWYAGCKKSVVKSKDFINLENCQ